MFIGEIFGGKSPDDFDEETIITIHKFFYFYCSRCGKQFSQKKLNQSGFTGTAVSYNKHKLSRFPKNSWEIMKLLEEINEKGTTVLVVTHNREIVNAMKKRVVTMNKGVIVSDQKEGSYIDEI